MSVQKVNGFAAPYRSATFRAETDALVHRNGILSMEEDITEDNGDVIVPPFEIVQEGLVIKKTNVTTVVKPIGLKAPYYLTVNAPTPTNSDDLVFQFAKSPYDISSNEVILADYDGIEWKMPAFVSIDGLLEAKFQDVIDMKEVGPYSGLLTSIDGSNYKNTSGLIFDKRGDKIVFEKELLVPSVGSDPNPTWRRVDRMVYRRPADTENRIGVRKFLVGGTYAPTGSKKSNYTEISNPTKVSTISNVVISQDNTVNFFYTEGFGSEFTIRYKKFSSDRTTMLNQNELVANNSSDQFNVAMDASGNMHVIYESFGDIKLLILDPTGAVLYGPIVVDGVDNPCANPQVAIDPLNLRLFIAFEYLQGPNNKQLYIATRDLTGALITPAVRITDTITNTIHPSIDVSDDLLVHMAYEESGVIKYLVLDDIGQVVTEAKIVSAATGSASFGTLVNNAFDPILKVADNKEVFIAFRQRKNSSDYGIAIYSNGSAFLPNLISASENITNFSMCLDSFDNDLHICASQAGRVDYVLVKDRSVAMSETLQNAGADVGGIKKDRFGSLVHTWTNLPPGTFTNTGTAKGISHIGPIAVSGLQNPLALEANQLSFPTSISIVPKVGMRISVAGSTKGNNGNYVISVVDTQSINATNDTYVLTVEEDFTAVESPASPATAQFANPDGNTCAFIKSVADLGDVRALRTTELSSDVILARISWPGPIILNYIPQSGIGVNSDLFGMYGDIDVDWAATAANTLTMTNGLKIIDLVTSNTYSVSGGSFPMQDGDALYVTMDGTNFNITPGVSPITALPWATPIQVLGFVKLGEFHPHLFSVAGMGQLDVGEQIVLGQDLSKAIRLRLGITSEASMGAYTSATIINATDPYHVAIGKLDAYAAAFGLDHALEDEYVVTNPAGATIFTAVDVVSWNADNNYIDIVVFVNGQKQRQDKTGGLTRDYRKISTTQIEFAYTVPKNAQVIIRKERTGAPPVAASIDLTSIGVQPQPQANGSQSIGSTAKGWKNLYMKDTLSNKIYEIKIVNGVLQAVEVV